MRKIKKLSTLQLKELSSEMQKTVLGGMEDARLCMEKFGPCPEGMVYFYQNGNCYCMQGEPEPGGGSGGGSTGGGARPCPEGQYCFPSDGCSSFFGLGGRIANNTW